jgi:DNA-binding winged helix-turn-helix (wHTH) protein/TolB-like protein
MTYRFGLFEFDDRAGILTRSDRPVALEPQPARALALLLARAGDLVMREEMRAHLWGADTHVDFDRGLAYCVGQLRAALGDTADNPRFIQTLPRRGFSFIAPVDPSDDVRGSAFFVRRPGFVVRRSSFDGAGSAEHGTESDEPRTPNDERRTTNLEQGTTNVEPRTTNVDRPHERAENDEPRTPNDERRTTNADPRTTNVANIANVANVRSTVTALAVATGAVVLLIVASVGWWTWARGHVSDRPIVAVAVFDNETGDASRERAVATIADVVVERLTALGPSRIGVNGNSKVLRNPRADRDPRTVARETHASFLVAGHLQTKDGRLSLLMHIIRLDDGTHVWVQRISRSPDDELESLDEDVAAQIEKAVRRIVLKDGAQVS